MKQTKNAPVTANEFEWIIPSSEGDFLGRRFYGIDGKPGLWRRIGRTGRGLKAARPDAVVAYSDGSIIELVRDTQAESELIQAGLIQVGLVKALPNEPPASQNGPEEQERLKDPVVDLRESNALDLSEEDEEDDEEGEPDAAVAKPLTPAQLLAIEKGVQK